MSKNCVIDSHLHIWDPQRAAYDWLDSQPEEIRRTIGIDEALPELRMAGVDASILVQAADNVADTDLMIETMDAHPEIAAVVAWAPLSRPAEAAERIRDFAADPRIVGVRTLLHNYDDADWMLRPDVDTSLCALEAAGLAFDVVAVLPRHLEIVRILALRHPGLRIVVDHLANPPIGVGSSSPWWDLLAIAADAPNVFAKVSGLYFSTTDPAAWSVDLLRPFFRHAVSIFGAERLMYGSDWPVSLLAGGYQRVWNGIEQLVSELSRAERESIYGATAVNVYRIGTVDAKAPKMLR